MAFGCRAGTGLGDGRLFGRRFVASVATTVVTAFLATLTGVVVSRRAFHHADAGSSRFHFGTSAVLDHGATSLVSN